MHTIGSAFKNQSSSWTYRDPLYSNFHWLKNSEHELEHRSNKDFIAITIIMLRSLLVILEQD